MTAKLQKLWGSLKSQWKTPLPGEYTNLKEFLSYCFGVMGICGFTFICGETVSFASGYFCGAIMQIKLMDFTIISIIGLIVKYATLYIESLSMTIFENMGNIAKNKAKKAMIAYLTCVVVGVAFYFIPSKPFESIIKGLPGIVGNILVVMGAGGIVNWFLRKKLCPKYGKYKPFMIIYGVPITLLTVAMTLVPVTMEYSWKIVRLHFLVTLRGRFTACYSDTPTAIVALITPNMVERQKYYSIGAIFLGLFRSIFRIIFPILIVYTGGYFDIRSYRLFVPIFAIVSLLMGLLFIGVKERVTEQAGSAPKVEFKKSAKELLKNKFFWIIEASKTFETWMGLGDTVINLILIYQMRATWLTGVISLFGITSVLGNLLTPMLVKKFEKRTCILFMRAVWLAITASYFIALKFQSIPIFIILLFIRAAISAACGNITSNMSSDVLVYHQWKTGERADNMRNIFNWFTTPIGTALGLVSPWLLAKLGYTSDWDVLFDPNLFYPIMKVYIALSVISIAISSIPYFFYNLKKADHDRYVAEILARTKEKETAPESVAPAEPAMAGEVSQ